MIYGDQNGAESLVVSAFFEKRLSALYPALLSALYPTFCRRYTPGCRRYTPEGG